MDGEDWTADHYANKDRLNSLDNFIYSDKDRREDDLCDKDGEVEDETS